MEKFLIVALHNVDLISLNQGGVFQNVLTNYQEIMDPLFVSNRYSIDTKLPVAKCPMQWSNDMFFSR